MIERDTRLLFVFKYVEKRSGYGLNYYGSKRRSNVRSQSAEAVTEEPRLTIIIQRFLGNRRATMTLAHICLIELH